MKVEIHSPFKDNTPAMYMAARWLTDSTTIQQQAMAQIPALVADLQRLAAIAQGVAA